MNTPAPFTGRPAKPLVTRTQGGRIAIFIGAAYQYTDDEGARSMRDQLNAVLAKPTPRERFEEADRQFITQLTRELDHVECGGEAPPVIATKKPAP